LPPKELLSELLRADRSVNNYESLIGKLNDSPDFREKLLQGILEIVPQLVNEDIVLTERGFKIFMALY
jgi:hypothetical protein